MKPIVMLAEGGEVEIGYESNESKQSANTEQTADIVADKDRVSPIGDDDSTRNSIAAAPGTRTTCDEHSVSTNIQEQQAITT